MGLGHLTFKSLKHASLPLLHPGLVVRARSGVKTLVVARRPFQPLIKLLLPTQKLSHGCHQGVTWRSTIMQLWIETSSDGSGQVWILSFEDTSPFHCTNHLKEVNHRRRQWSDLASPSRKGDSRTPVVGSQTPFELQPLHGGGTALAVKV